MDGAVLPLTFYCRNAQLCLQKASESQSGEEELQHLKAFTTLVSRTIPSHPLFRARIKDQAKLLLELQAQLDGATGRMKELECHAGGSSGEKPPHPTTNGKHMSRPPSRLLIEESQSSGRTTKTATPPPPKQDSSSSKSSSDPMIKTNKTVRIAATSKPPPSAKPVPEKSLRWDVQWASNMNETYGVVAKCSTATTRPVSLVQKLKRSADALAVDSKSPPHQLQNGKDVPRSSSQGLHIPAGGEMTPYRPRSRDSSRIRGATAISSIAGRGGPAAKAVSSSSAKSRASELSPYGTGDDSSSPHEELGNSDQGLRGSKGVTKFDNSGFDDTEVVRRGRSEAKDTPKETVVVKGSTKSKLANHQPPVRGILRHAVDDADAHALAERQASRRGPNSGGIVGTNDEEEEDDNWIEVGNGNSRDSQSSGAGIGDESTMSDGSRRHVRSEGDHHEKRRASSVRGEGLREWKGGFVREEQLQQSYDPSEFHHGGTRHHSRAATPNQRHEGTRRSLENSRPASAPRRMQGGAAMERKLKQGDERLENPQGLRRELRIPIAGMKVVRGGGTSPPLAQRGVKEDCERFRRQMRLLKQKADVSRIREEDVESMADNLQRRLVDEMDLAAGDTTRPSRHGIREAAPPNYDVDFREPHRLSKNSSKLQDSDSRVEKSSESLSRTMTRLMKEGFPLSRADLRHASTDPTTVSTTSNMRPSTNSSSSVTASASTSATPSTSVSSLPLSHYIQKLKRLTPDSRLGTMAGHEAVPSSCPRNDGYGYVQNEAMDGKVFTPESVDTGTPASFVAITGTDANERRELGISTASPGSSTILLPTSSSTSSHGLHRPPAPPRFIHRLGSQLYPSLQQSPQILSNRTHVSDSSSMAMLASPDHHMSAILGGCAMVAGHLQEDGKYSNAAVLDQLYFPPDDSRSRIMSRIYENAHQEANDEKIANIQRVLGELKGSVEGVKIRIEVEGEGWRGRVEGLEKEIENLKEEADDEIIATKHSIRNEFKIKIGDFMADVDKMRREEREKVEMMVDARIEKQLQAHRNIGGSSEMKNEIRLLWAEVEALSKNREEMQGQMDHLISMAQKAQEHASREQDILKNENGFLRNQLQSLKNDGVQVRMETEDIRVEKEDLRQAVEKLRNDGTDMKQEIQALKKVERVLKVEIENTRSNIEKVHEETEALERERARAQMEGGRERMLIMERVESLSQLYLGGLEEVRSDVFNVKFSCRDRADELESQWNEFKRHQENSSEEGSSSVPRQMLMEELDHFRNEISEMVELERGLLRETLERESASIRRQVLDAYANNKSEILSMLKVEIQKRLQNARDKVFVMTDALKRDMDNLKEDLGQAQEGAQDLSRAVSVAERQKDNAAAAAAEATVSATKAKEVLAEMLATINSEVANARRKTLQLQENLALEKDMATEAASEARRVSEELLQEKESALQAVQEARLKNQEMQEYLERESSKLVQAMLVVQQERDTAAKAASDATSSALKAGEVLAEVLGTLNLETARARRVSSKLQEGLEDREAVEQDRELAIRHSQEGQDRFSEDLELAIAGWKRAINAEVAKAKELGTEGLDNESKRRAFVDPNQENLRLTTGFVGFTLLHELESYISKTENTLSSLTKTVTQLQDSRDNYHEEKRRRVTVKQQENERKERDWKCEITQLNQVVRAVEKRVHEASLTQSETNKRMKRVENTQADLVQSVEEVRTNTSDLGKTISMWLPRYEAAARVVNDLSSKVERVEARFEGFACDEGLEQQISRVAETKVQSLKDLVISTSAMKDIGLDLQDLHERVENSERAQFQAVAEVENRVARLENTLSHSEGRPRPELSVKLEYTEKNNDPERCMQVMGTQNQSGQALERDKRGHGKMEMMTDHNGSMMGGQDMGLDSRLHGLENRIEHVASATFTNLQLLDSKVERVSVGVQSALEGAALAESKCGALGAELVKVFRMLTASKSPNNPRIENRQTTNKRGGTRRGRSHSPPLRGNHPRLDSRSQSPPSRPSGGSNFSPSRTTNRGLFSPMRRSGIYISPSRLKTAAGGKRGLHRAVARNGDSEFTKGTHQSSQQRRVTVRERVQGEVAYAGVSEEGGSSSLVKESWNYVRQFPRSSSSDGVKECKLHGHSLAVVNERRQHAGQPPLGNDREKGPPGKSCQKTNIRLEAGRIHVNVSHRNQSERRGDLIAVQS